MRNIRNLVVMALIAAAAIATTSCGTTEGFGRDMEDGGRAIKESARDHSD